MFPLTGFFCKEEPPFAGGLFFIFWLFTGLMTRLKHLAQHLRTSTNQSFSPWKPHLPFLHLPRLGASSHTKSLRSSTLSRPPPPPACVSVWLVCPAFPFCWLTQLTCSLGPRSGMTRNVPQCPNGSSGPVLPAPPALLACSGKEILRGLYRGLGDWPAWASAWASRNWESCADPIRDFDLRTGPQSSAFQITHLFVPMTCKSAMLGIWDRYRSSRLPHSHVHETIHSLGVDSWHGAAWTMNVLWRTEK